MLLLIHVIGVALIYSIGVFTGVFVMRSMQKEFDARAANRTTPSKRDTKKILELVSAKGEIANDDVQALLKVSDSTAQRYLAKLTDAGKLSRHGKTTNIRYTAN